MAIGHGKADAGQGGKRGHSNMDHWVFNDEIKEAARKQRRLQAKDEIVTALAEREVLEAAHWNQTNLTDEFSQ